MVIKNALIVLKWGDPVAAFKYSSFYNPAKTVESRLPNLPFNLHYFSLCKLANDTKVILSGGHWEFGKRFPTV